MNEQKLILEKTKDIILELLNCSDGKYITEIYAKEGSVIGGEFTGWISLMIEADPAFVNESLYGVMDDIDERYHPFTLHLSIEPDMVERGHGIVLWTRSGGFEVI